ncbi:MAG: hypothetical protein QNJ13_11160 [Paracoccaceae bacterium]|nr:hypothetical protein [Paracoccaceae bacterium]
MNSLRPPHLDDAPCGARKPRVLMCGEFSAGKTFLINGLLGATVLPSSVTATALPPVWLTYGTSGLARIGLDGTMSPVTSPDHVDLENTRYCLLHHRAPILESMDLIDTPGTSDPSIDRPDWTEMLDAVDVVVWCTNATQAWRQSEKAVWDDMPDRLRDNAVLVVTHADLLRGGGSAQRVLGRVEREAGRYFDRILLASLLAPEDIEEVASHLIGLCEELTAEAAEPQPAPGGARRDAQGDGIAPESPNVAAFRPPDREQGAAAPAGATTARAVWDRLSSEIDLGDPAAILGAVDRLIATLDAPARQPKDSGASQIVDWKEPAE